MLEYEQEIVLEKYFITVQLCQHDRSENLSFLQSGVKQLINQSCFYL
jgi:hypothetical protein